MKVCMSPEAFAAKAASLDKARNANALADKVTYLAGKIRGRLQQDGNVLGQRGMALDIEELRVTLFALAAVVK